MTPNNLKVGETYTIHFAPTFTGQNKPKKMRYDGTQHDTNKRLHYFSKPGDSFTIIPQSEIPKRVTTELQLEELGDSNVLITDNLDDIKFYLDSKAMFAAGQGEINDEYYLLSHGSPSHEGWKRTAIVCTIDNYKKAEEL